MGRAAALDPGRKMLARADALAWRRTLPVPLVFTNGVFDVLHRGHVAYLAQARAEGGALLVAVNSDASARRLGKGPGRPVNTARDRAFVLAGLESVDVVVEFDDDTPLELIRLLAPEVLAKGADYTLETIVGAGEVTARGGRVVRVPLEEGYSTTNFMTRVTRGET